MMDIRQLYKKIRTETVDFCNLLDVEDYSVQVAPFVSPVKWHLAHTTWFFETFILSKYLQDYTVFNPAFGFLFNSYYNHVGERLVQANRGNLTRPLTQEVLNYRSYVDQQMDAFLANEYTPLETVILGLNHEQQHQELLKTDVKYMLGHNPLFPPLHSSINLVATKNTSNKIANVPAGTYSIGHNSKGFCYDNELGVHTVYLDEFNIQDALVTNEEYLEFMEAGAYSNFDLWLDEGWTWINQNKVKAPLYWHKKEGIWHSYTLAGLKPIEPNEQLCHINFYEASAYAAWRGKRLPTEFEWEAASKLLNIGSRWEWTGSAYLPYPGFKKAEGAVGEYNGKFMSNKMVLRGGSAATPQGHARPTYRNFFHPSERWQFTGIRLID